MVIMKSPPRGIKKVIYLVFLAAMTLGLIWTRLHPENWSPSTSMLDLNVQAIRNNSLPGRLPHSGQIVEGIRTADWSPAYNYPHTTRTIPRIIHQTWDTYKVPVDYEGWIKTWVEQNPEWEYWFWSEEDVRELLQTRYPQYLTTYEHYKHHLSRADAMRYFIMDSIGGYYADLDVNCLRSMDNWTYDPNGCMLSEETHVHSFVLHKHTKANVMTTILGCRPGHPFYKQVICGLPIALEAEASDTMYNTGPWFLDTMYNKFLKHVNDTQGIQTMDTDITILDPKYLLPTYDSGAGVKSQCRRILEGHQEPLCQRARHICRDLYQKKYNNKPENSSYTDHHWVHVITNEKAWRRKKTISIFDMVPGAKTFRQINQDVQSSAYYKPGTLSKDRTEPCQIKLSPQDFKMKLAKTKT